MFLSLICFSSVMFLAFSNGANDNFKGVATLYGSKTTDFKSALRWANATTLSGSMCALVLGNALLLKFTAKGILPDSLILNPHFGIAIALSAAATVMIASQFGFPISTTHSLIGAILGAAIVGFPSELQFSKITSTFLIPLIVSPLIAAFSALMLYPFFHFLIHRIGLKKENCLCIGRNIISVIPKGMSPEIAATQFSYDLPTLTIGTKVSCVEKYQGSLLGATFAGILNKLHFLSGGLVSFTRGVNDTPKIAAILLMGAAFPKGIAIMAVACGICLGGFLKSKKVGETLAHKITTLTEGQGFTANLITSMLVLFSTFKGLPLSTTHVSCGALFGIGAVTKNAQWKHIFLISLGWVITLPLSLCLSAFFFWGLSLY
ncbi:MAG: inorganic phosphate transporter [Bdellovibrionales bacterium]|nr:inorganic phosphate transporter [Bdellovibrionales bacterium]